MAEEQEKKKGEQEEWESPPESLPSKLARVESSSSPDAGAVTTAVSSPLLVGLGLGLGGKESKKAENSTRVGGFTFMQMQEYHHQALIFKHMLAGIPVPVHLILPIWKSVAASYGPHHYPSFVGLGSLCYEFRNSMEPEPGRCRRTDGKKWRCSRDVVPDQKYCDRHMHRGRTCSRKPVEGAVAATAVVPATATASSTAADLSNSNNSNSSRLGSSAISVLSSSSAAAACKSGAS